MLTAIPSRSDLTRHARGLHLLSMLRTALATPLGGGESSSGEAPVARRAWLPGIEATLLSTSEQARGELRTLWQLRDGSQRLLAVMEATALKGLLSSVLSALAADLLAPPGDTTVAVLGQGPLLSGVLKSLRLVRALKHAFWWEPDAATAIERSMNLQQELSLPVTPMVTPEEACSGADLWVVGPGAVLPVKSLRPGVVVLVPQPGPAPSEPLPAAVQVWSDLPESAPGWATGARPLGPAAGEGPHLFAGSGAARVELLAAWHAWKGLQADDTVTRLDLEGER